MTGGSDRHTPAVGHTTAYLLAVFCMFIWGSPPTVARAVSGGIPPVALSFSRWLIAFLVVLPFVWKQLRREWPLLREHWKFLTILAASMTAGSTLSVIAVYFTTATNAVLVNASQPAVTALLAWVVTRDRLTSRQSLGIGCAFLGILVMICRADFAVLATLDINAGDLVMLMAVVGWSLYAVKLHRGGYTPSSELLLCLIAAFGTIALFPAYLIEAASKGSFRFTAGVSSAMLYLAVFPTLLATYSWNLSIRSLGANRAAIFVNLIPVFGAVFAMVFLGERLFFYHLFGAALVFVGIFFAARQR